MLIASLTPRVLQARPVLVVLACRRLPPRGWNQPASASPPICSKCMFQMFQRYVASILYGCCKSRSRCCICCKCFRGMVQAFIQNVLSCMLQAVFIWMLHMFHTYVSVLCYNKCFYFASCKCFIYMMYMFYTHVAIVCSKCFICFRCMLHPNVSYFNFQGRESWRHEPVAGGWGDASHGPAVRARSVPRIPRMGRARPHAGSWVPPT
jgi:hypothetical protein